MKSEKQIMKDFERNNKKHSEASRFYNWRDSLDSAYCSYDCKNCEKLKAKEKAKFKRAEKAYEKKWGVNWFTQEPSRIKSKKEL